jgi:drug/metabolite transporter (DMT)-like permease
MLGVPATHTKAAVSALVSGLIAFFSSLATALQGEHSGFSTVTAGQWVTAVLAGLVGSGIAGAATSRASNAAPAQPAGGSSDLPGVATAAAPSPAGRTA